MAFTFQNTNVVALKHGASSVADVFAGSERIRFDTDVELFQPSKWSWSNGWI